MKAENEAPGDQAPEVKAQSEGPTWAETVRALLKHRMQEKEKEKTAQHERMKAWLTPDQIMHLYKGEEVAPEYDKQSL